MSKYAPDNYISNPKWNWGPYYVQTVKAIMDGTWKTESYFGSMKDGITDIAPFGKNVPQDVQDLVEAKKTEILDGKFDVFNGPIADQSGAEKVAQGKAMTVDEILNMNWFVKGIVGTIPQ
jgi:basic membrane protein A